MTLNPSNISADNVHAELNKHILADGYSLVLDLTASQGSRLVDARDNTSYLDLFTFFASSALGMNHPALVNDEQFTADLLTAARNKPSNSDVYTVEMAQFVDTFARVLGDPALPFLFFVEGGALAVENALKVAFDWKSRMNEKAGLDSALGTKVLHLKDAFHGRSGYTLSLMNPGSAKTARFPRFDWPRIDNPYVLPDTDMVEREFVALAQARLAFETYPDDIACFIMEPIQGEGGDRHFRAEFMQEMQALCLEFDALFILDEVQTGGGLTGTPWAYQQLDVKPDVVAFGKKTQVCGIMAGGRLTEIDDHVFAVSSRINSTWGGNLTDMVRARRILEVIETDDLISEASTLGIILDALLDQLAIKHSQITDVRGRGLMRAFTLPDADIRDRVITALRLTEHVLLLPSGERSIRFRPALTVTVAELEEGVVALGRVLESQL